MRRSPVRAVRRRAGSTATVVASTGNVFKDLNVPESGEALAKADLAIRIADRIQSRAMTQTGAAALLGISQADVSDLVRGKLKGFSTERLFRFLNALGQDIEIVIRDRGADGAGYLRVLSEQPERPSPRRPRNV